MEQSSILFAKIDCPVARQNVSLVATAHDCETGLFLRLNRNLCGSFVQGILYADFLKEKEKWEEEKTKIQEEKRASETAREQDKGRLLEFEVHCVV